VAGRGVFLQVAAWVAGVDGNVDAGARAGLAGATGNIAAACVGLAGAADNVAAIGARDAVVSVACIRLGRTRDTGAGAVRSTFADAGAIRDSGTGPRSATCTVDATAAANASDSSRTAFNSGALSCTGDACTATRQRRAGSWHSLRR
jgi:hypothetical protein